MQKTHSYRRHDQVLRRSYWSRFGGFGGGVDYLLTRHIAVSVQADLVRNHLFGNLLQNGRWTTRFSVGPAFNFGKNIVQ